MRIVLCAAPVADAPALARTVVEERLAACVQAVPGVRSTYRWQGRVEEAEEVQLWCKVAASSVDALVARLTALHPYEVPEILVLEVDAAQSHAGYVTWVRGAGVDPTDAEGGA